MQDSVEDTRRAWRVPRSPLQQVTRLGVLVVCIACAAQPGMDTRSAGGGAAASGGPVDGDLERLRAATAKYRSLDSAVSAGYRRDVLHCVDNPPQGAMGYHHQNDALLDDKLEVERPEILVYERLPNREYRLNGVEYIVPFSVLPATATPPEILGRALRPAPSLGLWYLHVWIWHENPSGLFADWHPGVKC